MARLARLDAPGTLYHMMIRGIERPPIFKDDQDRKDFKRERERVCFCNLTHFDYEEHSLDTGQILEK